MKEILVTVILVLFSQKQSFKNSTCKVQLGFWLQKFSPMFWSKYVHQTDVTQLADLLGSGSNCLLELPFPELMFVLLISKNK